MRRFSSPQPDLSTSDGLFVVECSLSPRRPDRYRVTVEDTAGTKRAMMLPDVFVARNAIRTGVELDAARSDALLTAASECDAYDRAIGALGRRGYARAELERWLMQRGIAGVIARAQVARLAEQGVINDERFADDFVRARVARRGASTWELRRDLGRKGVAREIADAAIRAAALDAGLDDSAVARRAAESKWRSLRRLAPDVAKRRLVAFLRRRGFGGEVVANVLRDIVKMERTA
jgi:regulatory protein